MHVRMSGKIIWQALDTSTGISVSCFHQFYFSLSCINYKLTVGGKFDFHRALICFTTNTYNVIYLKHDLNVVEGKLKKSIKYVKMPVTISSSSTTSSNAKFQQHNFF